VWARSRAVVVVARGSRHCTALEWELCGFFFFRGPCAAADWLRERAGLACWRVLSAQRWRVRVLGWHRPRPPRAAQWWLHSLAAGSARRGYVAASSSTSLCRKRALHGAWTWSIHYGCYLTTA
jgi:hypothetical protein